jgi:hypothetical protein
VNSRSPSLTHHLLHSIPEDHPNLDMISYAGDC